MQQRLLLDVVLGQRAAILQLLAGGIFAKIGMPPRRRGACSHDSFFWKCSRTACGYPDLLAGEVRRCRSCP
eukprot:10285847-Heterocapsa_arctica.AAC.1